MSAAAIEAAVRAEGLLEPGRATVVLLSGGRDSVCLLDLATRIAGPGAVAALHVDYRLRPESGADAEHCAALCDALGVALHVRRAGTPEGNRQAWARELRSAAAEELARERDAVIAAGHTSTDQVETVLYRLAASPGRRALLGMPARSGRLVRPLLSLTREQTAAYCSERGLAWREDASNASPAYARNRVRHGLLDDLRAIHPAAEANVLRTLATLRDEASVLDAAVDAALRELGDAPEQAALAALPPALARLALQALADGAVERAPAVGPRLDELLALGGGRGSAGLDLGGGLRAVAEYGRLRFEPAGAPAGAEPATLPVPGRAGWAGGELTCERGPDLPIGDGTLDAGALARGTLEVRAWHPGDRMRPLGLRGTRTLQDLFTDRKIPRARRARWPVITCAGEIAWIPRVATGERYAVGPATRERVRLSWRETA
ncbi:MAG TPA: tRNA lysidine(34) synthetase TilS [Solirubrobacteraceae bacterium]|nr:tRNA lysidine(34) synthetase TilS [Solirubrobacteraceae bacterium]